MGWDGTIRSWSYTNDEATVVYRSEKYSLHCLAFSPDSVTILAGTVNGDIRFISYGTGEVQQVVGAHEHPISGLVLNQRGTLCYSSSGRDSVIKCWDCASGELVNSYVGHKMGIFCLAVSRDNRYLASAGVDRTLRIWETSTGKLSALVKYGSDSCWALSFSPNGAELAASFNDRSVRVYDCKKLMTQHARD
jgi:WD40 repeat protein